MITYTVSIGQGPAAQSITCNNYTQNVGGGYDANSIQFVNTTSNTVYVTGLGPDWNDFFPIGMVSIFAGQSVTIPFVVNPGNNGITLNYSLSYKDPNSEDNPGEDNPTFNITINA